MTIFTKQNLNPIFDITFMLISLFQICVFRSLFHLVCYLISPETNVRYFLLKIQIKMAYAQMLKYIYE